ncbi:hypothetical protein [Kitasatospora sp. NPDC001547]|uniref:hypothetical protein n=1 Tax=Kitasatospora sp. NPDC001547 TaxID=3364015 RepID=UPI0036B812DC
MYRRKIRSVGVLPAASALLGLAAATPAVAEETAKVVVGEPSAPDGWSSATCPSGTHLTGGGYVLMHEEPTTVVYNGPAPDQEPPTTWWVRAKNESVRAFAVCETED